MFTAVDQKFLLGFLCGVPQWSSWRYFIGLMNLFLLYYIIFFYYINILSLINLYLEKYKIIKVTTSYIVFFIVARWFSKSMTFVKWKLPLKHPIERRSIKSQSNTSKNNLNIHRSTIWSTLNQQNIAAKSSHMVLLSLFSHTINRLITNRSRQKINIIFNRLSGDWVVGFIILNEVSISQLITGQSVCYFEVADQRMIEWLFVYGSFRGKQSMHF